MRLLSACVSVLVGASASGQVTIEELYRRSTVLAGDRWVSFDPIAGLTPGVDNGKPIDYLLTRDLTNVPFSSLIEWQDDGSSVVIDEYLRLFSSDPAGYLPVLAEDGVQVFSLVTGTPPLAALESIAMRSGGATTVVLEPGDPKPNGGAFTRPLHTFFRNGWLLVQDSVPIPNSPGFVRDSIHRMDMATLAIEQPLSRGDIINGSAVDEILAFGPGLDGQVCAVIEDPANVERVIVIDRDGSVETVVTEGDTAPDGRIFQRFIGPPIMVSDGLLIPGRVQASVEESRDGVYLWDGTTLTEIVPDFAYADAAVDANDNLLIRTSINSDTLIAVIDSSGSVTEVYSEADPLAGGTTGLVGFGTDAIDGETVVFSALIQFPNNDLASVVFRATVPSLDPCPADTNDNGVTDPGDFTVWVNAYNRGLPACDQNADGVCDPGDFTAWIAGYNIGCD
ncbi:MAG: GC-type dockerin domain-anchored protein [Phycisphaerales bacterium]